jgi:hypothetical protein
VTRFQRKRAAWRRVVIPTDVSGEHIGPIFNCQACQKDESADHFVKAEERIVTKQLRKFINDTTSKPTLYFTYASLMETEQTLQHCLLSTVCCKSHPHSLISLFPYGVPSVYFLPCSTQRHCQLLPLYIVSMGRHSSVGIATRYGLEGPGIESRWERDCPHFSSPGAHPASYTMGTGSLSWG